MERNKSDDKRTTASRFLKAHSRELDKAADLDQLMDRIGDARIVMLGEASHGTHDYYTWRTRISHRLITEKHFNFIAVEGDWPDAYRLNRYIKHYTETEKVTDVLHEFNRWPTWMWANWEIAALIEKLYQFNSAVADQKKIGFYGLDVYSLFESLESILHYLEKNDHVALEAAEKAFECFEPYRNDEGRAYAYANRLVPGICENDVIQLLKEMRQKSPIFERDDENAFSAEQNALIAVNAEKYYRAMLQGSAASWNVRDMHMEETLERLLEFHGTDSRAIVWEHNTHIGDARATDMQAEGMYNIGELARKKFGKKAVALVGFGSWKGSVIAGKKWGAPMERMQMPAARKGSWEDLLHEAGGNRILITDDIASYQFDDFVDHRAIGVVYNPDHEKYGNYVPSIIPERYDAFIFLDQTMALHPLHLVPDGNQLPETYPFGI